MVYLIVGTIITLSGIGLMMNKDSLIGFLGIIVFLVGGAIGLKGRKTLDKFMGRKDK
jgi:hypothetical protein